MKILLIKCRDCDSDDLEFIEDSVQHVNIITHSGIWFHDMTIDSRVLTENDILELTVTEEQETLLRLRFMDKIYRK